MTATATLTPSGMVTGADAIVREVREAEWPDSRQAQHGIAWAYATAADARDLYARLLNEETTWSDDRLLADAGWPDDPETSVLEHAADAYHQAATALRNEYRRHGGKS